MTVTPIRRNILTLPATSGLLTRQGRTWEGADVAVLDEALTAWALHMRAGGATAATIQTRVYGVRAFANRANPLTASTDDVAHWLSDCRAAWTRKTYWATACQWFGWLVDTGHRADNPVTGMRPVKAPRRVPRPVTDRTLDTLHAAAHGNTRVYIILAAYAGLRVHEIAKVRGEDVTATALRVVGKGGREDYLPVHPLIAEAALSMPRRGWWFPSVVSRSGHVAPNTVSTVLSRLFRDIGVDATAHALRHTFVSRVYASSGHDILTTQQLARHQDPSTTAGYALIEDGQRQAAVFGLRGVA